MLTPILATGGDSYTYFRPCCSFAAPPYTTTFKSQSKVVAQ